MAPFVLYHFQQKWGWYFVFCNFRDIVVAGSSKMVKYKFPPRVFENGKIQHVRMRCALGLHWILLFAPQFHGTCCRLRHVFRVSQIFQCFWTRLDFVISTAMCWYVMWKFPFLSFFPLLSLSVEEKMFGNGFVGQAPRSKSTETTKQFDRTVCVGAGVWCDFVTL